MSEIAQAAQRCVITPAHDPQMKRCYSCGDVQDVQGWSRFEILREGSFGQAEAIPVPAIRIAADNLVRGSPPEEGLGERDTLMLDLGAGAL